MLPITIEDLVLYICDPMNGFDKNSLAARDRSIFFSMASQLRKPLALTERQAELANKIILDNIDLYKSIDNIVDLLENPIYKYPFRVIDTSRKIFLHEDMIGIKFPFDNTLHKLLEKIPGRRVYDTQKRSHMYKLNEHNIRLIVDLFNSKNFEIEEKIFLWYNEILKIVSSPQDHIPSALLVNNRVSIANCSRSLVEYFEKNKKDNLISDLLLVKKLNLYVTPELYDQGNNYNCHEFTKKILLQDKNQIFISAKKEYKKSDIANLIVDTNISPVLILIDESDKMYPEFVEWINEFNSLGISNNEISVLFRSDKNVDFNNFIKDNNLNNHVSDNIKVVFIKHKIPKILYKIDFNPSLIISTSVLYVHYTSQKLVDSHSLVLYYTEQNVGSIGKKIATL